ncbi:MAG: MFS transporter [Xanthobacteraceae bacterium]|nr:MFS transporter [Xanthobacteraceae bacterium]MBX3549102.1 MFS transporter [Xanthobacteraceae bacterium]MCW5676628.1 MFS transporter [Xanthobacteraceae bacterium]
MPGNTRIFYGWYIVAAVCLITTIGSGLAFYNLSVLLNAFVEERGFPVSLTSAAIATFFVSGGCTGVVVGRFIDRFDARFVIAASAALGAACLYSVSYLQSTWQLFVFHVAFGAAYAGAGLVALTTVVTRWFNAKRALAMSIAFTGLSFGGIFVAPFVALSIERGGLASTGPWTAALFFLGIAPVALLVLRGAPAQYGLEPDGGAGVAAANGNAASALKFTYADAKRSPFFYAVSISYLFLLGAQVGAIAHLYRLANTRSGVETAALVLVFLSSASIVGRLTGGWLTLKIKVWTFALQLMAVQCVALFALAFTQGRISILAATVLFGVTIGNSLMMQPLLLAEKFGTHEYGRIYSMSQFIAMTGVAGGPVLMGVLYDWAGNYASAFVAASVVTLAGFLVLLFGSRS